MGPLIRYTLLQVPGWLLLGIVLWWATGKGYIGLALAIAIMAAWVLKDVALYPLSRKAFQKGPAIGPATLIGRHAETVTDLAPTGQIRIDGELWTARPHNEESIPAGHRIVIIDIDGLTLLVEPAD
jgi:membrane protein implicated in regulation of membrane protease activity